MSGLHVVLSFIIFLMIMAGVLIVHFVSLDVLSLM